MNINLATLFKKQFHKAQTCRTMPASTREKIKIKKCTKVLYYCMLKQKKNHAADVINSPLFLFVKFAFNIFVRN